MRTVLQPRCFCQRSIDELHQRIVSKQSRLRSSLVDVLPYRKAAMRMEAHNLTAQPRLTVNVRLGWYFSC